MRYQRLLHDFLLAAADLHPEKPAIVVRGERVTYAKLLGDSARFASVLQAEGLERGDRVVVFLENSWASAVSIFGTLMAGGVFVVTNPQTKEDKLRYMLDDCEASFLVTGGPLTRVAGAALTGAQRAPRVLTTRAAASIDGALDFEEALAAADPEPRAAGTIPVDLAALIYTSGSTGFPKGVMQTHGSMVFAAGSISQYLRLGTDDRILNVLPLAFDYGLYQLLMSMHLGATLVLEQSFAFPLQIVNRVREEEVTVFPGVPTVYATLQAMHGEASFELPSVRRVTNTAAALPPAFHRPLRAIFPNALVFAMYGLTECKRVCYLEPELLDERPSSVGRAIPGTETLLLSPDGDPVAPGEPGILHVRGPHVMLGYWNQPEQSAHMLREGPLPGERMLCTHDWFTSDEDGFLYFEGRSDDIIKTRGEKVSPIEVENALFGIPGIREAAVVGVPDPVLGEAVRAFVVPLDGSDLTEQDVIAACRTRLEAFMVPQEVVFLDDLPKTPSGKVRKKSLLDPVE